MDTIFTPEAIEAALKILALIVAGVPIAVLTGIFVQVAKWVGLLTPVSKVKAPHVAVAHSLALGGLWIALQFYPALVAPASIVVLGLYGGLFSALAYDKVWSPIGERLGFKTSTADFNPTTG